MSCLANSTGASDATVVMVTEVNKGILEEASLQTVEVWAASPNDLVIAITCVLGVFTVKFFQSIVS
jgi:hypothetical protein